MPSLTQLLYTTSGYPDADHRYKLVHDDQRRQASHRLAHQAPGQMVQPMALVLEAYLRPVGAAPG
jgi:hypothetical protein